MADLVFEDLLSPPRRKVCHDPFGAWLVALMGIAGARKNPTLS